MDGRKVTQRELRNRSGEILRAVNQGETFIITRHGVAVGILLPVRRPRYVPRETLVSAFADAAPIDRARFRAEIDAGVDQELTPRA